MTELNFFGEANLMICSQLSKLYLWVHYLIFSKRLNSARHFKEKIVISIGNLSAGGTGKTPVTIELATTFMNLGYSVLVCLRGYKGKSKQPLLVADSQKVYVSSELAGDEAILISTELTQRSKNQNFVVATGPDRAELIEKFGLKTDIVLLDDAFQNPSVARDFDLVLIDTTCDLNQFKVFPCGKFRENLNALNRASMVLLTRSNQLNQKSELWQNLVKSKFPNLPVFKIGIKPKSIEPVFDKTLDSNLKARQSVLAFCGIGNSTSFYSSVEELGFVIKEKYTFSDHHSYTERDLNQLKRAAVALNLPLITTEKDIARLSDSTKKLPNLYCLATELFSVEESSTSWKANILRALDLRKRHDSN